MLSLSRMLGCCVVIALAPSLSLAKESPTKTLAWKFKVGDVHPYRFMQDMDMTMAMPGAPQEIKTGVKQVMDMSWKVTEVGDDGIATVEQSIDRVQMEMQAPGQPEMKYDTSSKDAPTGYAAMVAPLFKAMTAEPFVVKMSPRGEILELKMPAGLKETLAKIPGAASVSEMFTEDGFKDMMQKSALVLPEAKDLKPGHEWTTTSELKNPQFGTLETKATYQYLGLREVEGKPYEVFSLTTEIEYTELPENLEMKVTEQKAEGEIFFDPAGGYLHSSKLKQDMTTDLAAGGREMKQNMVQTVLLERNEKKSGE